jgi:hypothetical protein
LGLLIENGKPSPMASSIAGGCIGAFVLFFGGGWLLGWIVRLLD